MMCLYSLGVPSQILALCNYLSYFKIYLHFDAELANLSNLEILILRTNQLNGTLPIQGKKAILSSTFNVIMLLIAFKPFSFSFFNESLHVKPYSLDVIFNFP